MACRLSYCQIQTRSRTRRAPRARCSPRRGRCPRDDSASPAGARVGRGTRGRVRRARGALWTIPQEADDEDDSLASLARQERKAHRAHGAMLRPLKGAYARYASARLLPWGRDRCGSALARAMSGAPPAPRRSRGLAPAGTAETCRRHLSPAPASRHGGRGGSASTRLPALRGSPRRLPRAAHGRPRSVAMQDMDSVARNRLARFAGEASRAYLRSRRGRAEPLRGRSRQWPLKRHAAPESLLPSAGRALRHSRAKAKGTPRPQRPRPFSRSSRDISRARAIASRMPRSVNPITRPVVRFTAKPSAAPLTLRTRPSASER